MAKPTVAALTSFVAAQELRIAELERIVAQLQGRKATAPTTATHATNPHGFATRADALAAGQVSGLKSFRLHSESNRWFFAA